MSFRIGDKVVVIIGDFKGEIGTVTVVEDNIIKVKFLSMDTMSYKFFTISFHKDSIKKLNPISYHYLI